MTILRPCNPSTGEPLGEVATDSAAEIAAKSARARDQLAWQRLTPKDRASCLRRAGPELRSAADALARMVTREMGKSLRESRREVDKCVALEPTLDEIETALQPRVIADGEARSVIHHHGFGIAAVITPWNYPVLMAHRLIVPALVAGNCVLFKPSERAPLVGSAYAAILARSLPPDVLQIVHGGGAQGAQIVTHADLIAFVGSRAVGRRVFVRAARTLKRLILELGGSDPMIVLPDADLELAVDFAVYNAFRNAGQACTCTRRIVVAQEIATAFEEALVARTRALRIGAGSDDGVDLGPLVDAAQKARLLADVQHACTRGATLLCGGDADGNFVRPMVLREPPGVRIAGDEEVFGPAVFLTCVATEHEAIERAAATPYGLGATVFTRDEARGAAIAARLPSGMVGVNRSCVGASGSPWVGCKQSGYGFHGSPDGHRQFAQTRVVTTRSGVSQARAS